MTRTLSRARAAAVAATGLMALWSGISAADMARLLVRADLQSRDAAAAGLGALAAEVGQFREALARGSAAPAALDARRRDLAMRAGAIEPAFLDADDQAARAALGGAALGLSVAALGGGDFAARARVDALARDLQSSLDGLVSPAARASALAVGSTLGAAQAEMLRLRVLLVGAGLSGFGLLAGALWRARAANRLARRDALTGLQNRLTFTETLEARLRDPGPGNEVALMLLDVDLFKEINDTLGHAAGDLLLRELASRLARLASPGLVVSRLGGDEFAVLIAAQGAHRAASDAVARVERLMAAPFALGGKPAAVRVSIGVALTPLQWCDAATLLRSADIALYAAKAAGRGTSRFFSPKMDRDFHGRRRMEEDLRRAVAEGGLTLHYQPMVDLETGAVVSCEALARWDRPGHGPVPPPVFIGLAEEVGLICDLGDRVLREACSAARGWPDGVRVSINLSPHQFDRPGFVSTVVDVLRETGLPAGRLELEITESLLLRDSAAVLTALSELRAMGVKIALDDFGTGYSSLSYLQRFAIDRIKIDQSFVRDMARRPEALAIVESICRLAARLGVSTTGEGIEAEEHAALLRGFGCVEGQGYLFGRPMPLDACARVLAEAARLAA